MTGVAFDGFEKWYDATANNCVDCVTIAVLLSEEANLNTLSVGLNC